MGVRRHRPGPPRPMGSPEAAPGQPEPERRRRPRQRRPPGRARQLRSRPPAAAGCIHFRRRRGGGTASGARGLKGRASRRGGRCPPTERRPGGAACGGEGGRRASPRGSLRAQAPRGRRGGRRPPAWVPGCRGCTAGSCPRPRRLSGVDRAPGPGGAAGTPRGSRHIAPPGVPDARGRCARPRGMPTPPRTPHLAAQVGAWPWGPSSTTRVPRAGILTAGGSPGVTGSVGTLGRPRRSLTRTCGQRHDRFSVCELGADDLALLVFYQTQDAWGGVS